MQKPILHKSIFPNGKIEQIVKKVIAQYDNNDDAQDQILIELRKYEKLIAKELHETCSLKVVTLDKIKSLAIEMNDCLEAQDRLC